MQQFAGGNASAAGDQTWDTQQAWHGTHFTVSLKKLLPKHADLHAETQNICLDQQLQNFGQNCNLQGSIGAEAAQHGRQHKHDKMWTSPMSAPSPNFWAELFKVNAALSMRFHPPEHTRKDARVHPVQNDRLKHGTNKPMNMDT